MLAGDFDARTQELSDTLATTHGVPGLDGLMPPGDKPNDLPPRRSLDPGVPSPFGHKLLALCQACNLFIMNGRVQGDTPEALMCYPPNGASLVDYVIASPELFSLQPTLKVHDLQPESDHCPLTLCIHSNLTVPQDRTKHAPIAQRLLLKHYPECADAFREVRFHHAQSSTRHKPWHTVTNQYRPRCKYCAWHERKALPYKTKTLV